MEVQPTLTPFYYLNNFIYLMKFVENKSASILSPLEVDFIKSFGSLKKQEQALYVRMFNRKGLYFNVDKFKYKEIKSIIPALKKLIRTGFASELSQEDAECISDILNIFTKEELVKIYNEVTGAKLKITIKRNEILLSLCDVSHLDICKYIAHNYNIIKQCRSEEAEMIKFLFFGSVDIEMSEFVIRDIGNADFEKYDEKKLSSYFSCRKEAEDKWKISNLYKNYKIKREEESAYSLYTWFKNQNIENPSDTARPVYDKFVNRLGYDLERNSYLNEALEIYSNSNQYPSRERRIRLLAQQDRKEEAISLCQQIITDSIEPKEKIFANDFLNRNGRAYRQKTIKLNEAESIYVCDSYKGRVEEGAMDYFSALGFKSFFAENYLWKSLFCLVFWDIIFDAESGTIHNPLQRAPSDFYSPGFFLKRKNHFDRIMNTYKTRKQLKSRIKNVWLEKYGKLNPLVGWDNNQLKMLNQLVKYLKPDQIYKVMLEMCSNLKSNCTGFPDLFVYNKKEYFFAEIKSPNDHLSDQQLFWMEFFKETDINTKLIRVSWR